MTTRHLGRCAGALLAILASACAGEFGDLPPLEEPTTMPPAEGADPAAPPTPPPGTRPAPADARVEVGPDRTITSATAMLAAQVLSGSGLVASPAGEWRVTLGEARHVALADRRSTQTTVFFLLAGSYQLTYTLAGSGARDALLVKVAAPAFTLAGRVLDDGRPAAGAAVEIVWHRSAAVVDTLRPGAPDGAFRFAGLVAPADDVAVRVRPL